jgi:hypothetical protein
MRVLSFWLTPFRASTWRRFGYAVVGLPVGLACVPLALVGRAGAAARVQRRLAGALTELPVPAPQTPVRGLRVLAGSVLGVVLGAVSWVLLQDLALLLFVNVAFPLRDYVSFGLGENFLPWDGWNLLWSVRVHSSPGTDPWANTYATSWGGPTLAGAWAVHAGLALLAIYPVLAWAVRGCVRLQVRAATMGG